MTLRNIISKMKPILYCDIVSPPVRKVLLTSAALEVDLELKEVDLFKTEHLKEEFIQLNPLHKVPVLEHNDLIICDSNAIIVYLTETSNHPEAGKLFPKDPLQRAKILDKLFFEANILFKQDAEIMYDIFQGNCKKLSAEQTQNIRKVYSYMELYLTKNDWIASDNMTLADLSCVSCISTLNLLHSISAHPRLCEWFQKCKQLPYYKTQNEEGINKLKKSLGRWGFEYNDN